MKNHTIHPKEFLIGAVIGSALGGVAALLMAPTSGEKIRKSLCGYCHKTEDLASLLAKKKQCFSKMLNGDGSDWIDKAKCAFQSMSEGMKSCRGEECDSATKDFMVGGVVGGVVGALTGLMLAPKSGDELRHDLADSYQGASEATHEMIDEIDRKRRALIKTASSKTSKWVKILKGVVEELTDDVQKGAEYVSENTKDFTDHRLNDFMELASIGFRLWERVKK